MSNTVCWCWLCKNFDSSVIISGSISLFVCLELLYIGDFFFFNLFPQHFQVNAYSLCVHVPILCNAGLFFPWENGPDLTRDLRNAVEHLCSTRQGLCLLLHYLFMYSSSFFQSPCPQVMVLSSWSFNYFSLMENSPFSAKHHVQGVYDSFVAGIPTGAVQQAWMQ